MTKRKPHCHEPECNAVIWEHGLCRKHFLSIEAAERAERLRYWKPLARSYKRWHYDLTRQAGPASWLPCVDCRKRAADWSYRGGAPNELISPDGPYVTDPTYYEPRCRSCHKTHDVRLRAQRANLEESA